MTREGLTEEDARARISLFDVNGLLEPSRTDLFDFQKPYAHPHAPSRDFVEVIKSLKPTAIIGVSTKGKAFTREVVEAMADLNERPIIFALSNPTEHAECTAEEALTWSKGGPCTRPACSSRRPASARRPYVTGQANNLYIFPAVGLAIYATRARRVTDEMFITAAKAVADQVTEAELDSGLLYPPQTDILQTEVATAIRVSEVIFDRGLAGVERPKDIPAFVESHGHCASRRQDAVSRCGPTCAKAPIRYRPPPWSAEAAR